MQLEVFSGRRYICNIFPGDLDSENNIGPIEVLYQIEREMRLGPLTLVSVNAAGSRSTVATTEIEPNDDFDDFEVDFEDED